MSYFIAVANQKQGPFTLEELKSQPLSPDTLVWRAGMPAWSRADQVPEINELLKTMPPPLPIVSQPTAQSHSWIGAGAVRLATCLFFGIVLAFAIVEVNIRSRPLENQQNFVRPAATTSVMFGIVVGLICFSIVAAIRKVRSWLS